MAYLIKFFVRILGVRTPPPSMEVPVMKIPLPIRSVGFAADSGKASRRDQLTTQLQLRSVRYRDQLQP
jgi:hypothetical protein